MEITPALTLFCVCLDCRIRDKPFDGEECTRHEKNRPRDSRKQIIIVGSYCYLLSLPTRSRIPMGRRYTDFRSQSIFAYINLLIL